MITIKLTRGYEAVVDDEDAESAERHWYAVTGKNGRVYATRQTTKDGKVTAHYLHREIMQRAGHEVTKRSVDHIDGDGLNNRRANLRVCSQSENLRNVVGPRVNNSSGYLGVSKHAGGWVARIRLPGNRREYLGIYRTPEEANEARLKAERELWGVQHRRKAAHGL